MFVIILSLVIGLALAFANGANDNFKGVATLYGSGIASFKTSLSWATLATFAGSLTAFFVAKGLIAAFSGKGLVSDAALSDPAFLLSVGAAAAVTVLVATRFGLPVSTTHALVGGLVGVGLLASATGVNFDKLGSTFFIPLLISPVVSLASAAVIYFGFAYFKKRSALANDPCLCVETSPSIVSAGTGGAMALSSMTMNVTTGTAENCAPAVESGAVAITSSKVMNQLHFLSAGAVSFARGLNDTPKLAAILLATQFLSPSLAIGLIAAVIAVGGLLNSRRVAETISHKVTKMNHDQGLVANVVTSAIVIGASKLGLPVSTTHVSCGSIFGIGTVTREARWKMIAGILLAWVTTLPMAAAFGAVSYMIIKKVIV